MMKRVIIISFDLIRDKELEPSYAIASLLAYLKNSESYGDEFIVDNICINSLSMPNYFEKSFFKKYFKNINFANIDTIAISAYVWNEFLINDLIKYLREAGFYNKIVLGGYQITYAKRDNLIKEYPDADAFICGYGELSLLKAIKNKKTINKQFYNEMIDINNIVSPYLTNVLKVPLNQKMIRIETKRGCPYRCAFCAHRDLIRNNVYYKMLDLTFQELALIKAKKVKRVNIIDPVFNIGHQYLDILKEIDRLNFSNTTFTLQTRFELILGKRGQEFLSLVKKTNSYLEFGIQSIIPKECKLINRPNNLKLIKTLFKKLNDMDIKYEVSLIYGLPEQTLNSFKQSIYFLQSNGCSRIIAYPLMLLKGTELFYQKKKWGMKEEILGKYNIPIVTESNSFSKDDWSKMKEISEELNSYFE